MKGLIELEAQRWAWSQSVFINATASEAIAKARSELDEIEENILRGVKDPTEYADAIMCVLDAGKRDGISTEDILNAFEQKNSINLNRKWKRNPDGSYAHIKTLEHENE